MITSASNRGSERMSSPHGSANHGAIDLRAWKAIRPPVDVKSCPSSGSRLLHPTVQIAPVELVKRLGTGCPGWFGENIHVAIGQRIELEFQGPVRLLAMYNEGARRDGETSINGFAPSKIRNFANKLTFVPAGCGYRERLWNATS